MRKIRILIVDDAVVIRRLLTDELSKDAHLEVVGTAANGRIALAKIPQLNPDLVTLDIEMPEMNGLEALAVIRKQYPFLPVIMFSTLTERGASETLEALSLGASDYVTKPANVGSVTLAMKHIHQELVPKIKAFCGKAAGINLSLAAPKPSAAIPLPQPRARVKPPSQVEVVAIGVSTGGPNALAAIFPTFPADLPVPIVIVQHMPPVFTKILAERLEQCSSLRVREGQSGATLQPGCAWIAPGGYHMIVERHGTSVQLQTHQGPPENSCRPAVDVLFRSVADVYGRETLAVVLTGMGQDGLRGCEPIHEAGGQILVQDEESSVVWGMPGFVANSGLADKVIPQDHIGVEITRRVMQGRLARVGVLEARGEG
ncbi:MAG: chemotaxis response regulator protein-glutamate methylesterase [Acidobacteria bacterium]|nr:chemotaxis response regulator protein-glutamate methylesterase [Acidobacteriota bacterium]